MEQRIAGVEATMSRGFSKLLEKLDALQFDKTKNGELGQAATSPVHVASKRPGPVLTKELAEAIVTPIVADDGGDLSLDTAFPDNGTL